MRLLTCMHGYRSARLRIGRDGTGCTRRLHQGRRLQPVGIGVAGGLALDDACADTLMGAARHMFYPAFLKRQ